MASITDLRWYRIADLDELPEGRVKTVAAGTQSLALTHVDGEYAALDNHCPHQGGPLGEGSIARRRDLRRAAASAYAKLPSSPHAELIGLAVKHATLTPGVSHLVFPDEVQTIPARGREAGTPDGRIATPHPPAQALAEARADRRASRPVIIVGHGARFDMPA